MVSITSMPVHKQLKRSGVHHPIFQNGDRGLHMRQINQGFCMVEPGTWFGTYIEYVAMHNIGQLCEVGLYIGQAASLYLPSFGLEMTSKRQRTPGNAQCNALMHQSFCASTLAIFSFLWGVVNLHLFRPKVIGALICSHGFQIYL